MKKVLITGSNGFIAKNLIEHLKRNENIKFYLYSKEDSISLLEAYMGAAIRISNIFFKYFSIL